MIDFDIFCQVKELWNVSEKDWLKLSNRRFLLSFFIHKKHPRGASIHEIKEPFPLKPSLIETLLLSLMKYLVKLGKNIY